MSAAEKLEKMALANGWQVIRQLSRSVSATGGNFSTSYLVEKDGKVGFLKAFDFSRAFEPGIDTAKFLQAMTSAYNNEREVLTHCGTKRLSKVVLALDHGEAQVPHLGMMEGRVLYIIFEMAAGDIRCQLDEATACDALWCIRALRDAALGLWQVHREMIAHQDIKPSNILSFSGGAFKVADMGRSSRKGQSIWYDAHPVAGDKGYAPPELIYGYTDPDFGPRRIGCDLYMLGNLAVFLFSGVNMTASLIGKLASHHRPDSWSGTYAEVLPYLQEAFGRVLEELEPQIEAMVRVEVMAFIRELCTPDLFRRGHPRGIGRSDQYSLQRYVSHLELVCKNVEIRLRTKRTSA